MDKTVSKIVKMLSDSRAERRYAAAMVLAELRVREAQVVEALGRCLQEDDYPLLQASAMEALAGVKSRKVADFVMPLLDSQDDELRAQAVALLANQGKQTAAMLTRELHSAPLARRRIIVNILARNVTDEDSLDRLLEFLPDPDIGEQVLAGLRSELDHMEKELVELLRKKITPRLKDKEWLADPGKTARVLRLLGYLRTSRLVKLILPFAETKNPVPVRLAALGALRRPLGAARATDAAFKALLGHAQDADPTLARAALDTLRGLPLCPEATGELMELAEGLHAEARAFALESLGRLGDPRVIRNLLDHLGGDDPAAHQAAVAALSNISGAGTALVKEIQATDDPARMELLCGVLRGHADKLKPAARRSIVALAVRALEEQWPTAEPLLKLLSAVDPEGYSAALRDRALSHAKAGRHQVAFALLNRLDAAQLLDADGEYAAVVAGLCSLATKKDLGRASRTVDPVLRHVTALVAVGYELAAALTADARITPDDLFYLGFNYSESKDDDEQELGAELLSHLASSAPRSKLGRSAKNKLKLMGLD